MTSYTTVFGGNVISPSQVSSIELNLTDDIILVWPLETAPNSNLAAQIIDITSTDNFSVTMPPANQVSNGQALIFNNLGSFNISVLDSSAGAIATIAPGAIFFIYVRDNSTAPGVWGAFQYGSAVSAPSVDAIAGPGLEASGGQIETDMLVTSLNINYTILPSDRATLLAWVGATGQFGLPAASDAGDGFYVIVRNSGTSLLTITTSGTDQVNGLDSLSLNMGDSCIITTDGQNWFTVGLGSIQSNAFNLIIISLAGLSGTYTLPLSAYNQIGYRFTGALSGNVNVVLPVTTQEYWVDNETTGFAFSLGVSGQSSPPVLASGQTGIFYSDGTKIVNAIGNVLSNPVSIAQGGTGATAFLGAQVNLHVMSAADSFLTAQLFR